LGRDYLLGLYIIKPFNLDKVLDSLYYHAAKGHFYPKRYAEGVDGFGKLDSSA
jgi:hypothetical protein